MAGVPVAPAYTATLGAKFFAFCSVTARSPLLGSLAQSIGISPLGTLSDSTGAVPPCEYSSTYPVPSRESLFGASTTYTLPDASEQMPFTAPGVLDVPLAAPPG